MYVCYLTVTLIVSIVWAVTVHSCCWNVVDCIRMYQRLGFFPLAM